MASNFHIISYKDGDSLYLSLSGDFYRGSAHELINKLTKNGNASWDIRAVKQDYAESDCFIKCLDIRKI